MTQLDRAETVAATDTCASFKSRAQSSQHTSTVLPPIFTSMDCASSLQSQAAHVRSAMTLSPLVACVPGAEH
jgi:hypothetical protein